MTIHQVPIPWLDRQSSDREGYNLEFKVEAVLWMRKSSYLCLRRIQESLLANIFTLKSQRLLANGSERRVFVDPQSDSFYGKFSHVCVDGNPTAQQTFLAL